MLKHEDEESLEGVSREKEPASDPRNNAGSGEAEIEALDLLDGNGAAVGELRSGSTLTVRTRLRYHEDLEKSALRLTLRSKKTDVDVFSTRTDREGAPLGRREAGDLITVDFTLEAPLKAGAYAAVVTASNPLADTKRLDQAEFTFKIVRSEGDRPIRGLVDLPTTVEVRDLQEQQSPSRSA